MLSVSRQCMRRIISTTSTRNYTNKTSTADDIDEKEEEDQRPTFLDDDSDTTYVVNTNKSRLLPQHRNMLHGKMPYSEPQSWIHTTEKYQRKMFGRYGQASGVDVRICFPTKEDLQIAAEKERIAHPYTLQELVQRVQQEKREKQQNIQKREDDIAAKLGKLESWKQELNAKIAKKEAEAQAAKERKERLVEEVRRHFGFKVDPREDRFKEMLEQKEKEQKRKDKEAKRKAKEEKMVAKLVQKNVNTDGAKPANVEN